MQLQKISGFIYAALAGVVGSVFLLGCAPNSANLKIQAGITMRAGNAEPVSNTKVFLTNRSISEIFKEQRLQFPRYLESYVRYWGTINEVGAVGFDLDYENLQQIDNSFKSSLIAQDVTDFNGQVSFSNLPIKKIYVVIATRLGSRIDANAWCVPVILKQGENKIVLTNENINLDLE